MQLQILKLKTIKTGGLNFMPIASIIKYEGDNNAVIWKHPCEDFNSLTQLIVHESQEAVFMMNGQALDLFGAGRYTLETQNIPLIGKALNRVTGDKSPFHCEVYFINKTEKMSMKWGTDSKVQFVEPTYGFPISIGANGQMTLRVDNSRKLLVKLVGTEKYLGNDRLVSYFRAFLMTKVKSYIAQVIKQESINIFEIDERLQDISDKLLGLLKPDFEEYGLVLEHFFVMEIMKPDGDSQYEKFKSLHFRQYADIAEAKIRQNVSVIDAQTEAQKVIIGSQAAATKRAQEGYTYQQERGFNVAEQVASNQAVGQFTNLGIGLGTMAGVGGTIAGVVGGSLNNAMEQNKEENTVCAKCGAKLPKNAKFCLECGEKVFVSSVEQVVCPNCGKNVVKGKFCPECGYKFIEKCPKCNADIPAGAKFCLHCGEKI